MTYFSTKIESITIHTLMKKALGVLMLSMLAFDQPVSARTVPVEVSTAVISPVQTVSVQPEIVAAPAERDEPTVQEVLLDVCKANDYGQDCAQTLLGMLWTESSNRSTVIGDNGKARGYFQIHYKLHKITIECAEDLVCSANWTIKYLKSNSYPKYVNYAVQCHNSCNVNNGYTAKVRRYGKYFWNQPLKITQAAPIELAAK